MDIQSRPVNLSQASETANPLSAQNSPFAGSSQAESQDELRKMVVIHAKSTLSQNTKKIISAPNPISEQEELFNSDSTKSLPDGVAAIMASKSGMIYDSLPDIERVGQIEFRAGVNQRLNDNKISVQEPYMLKNPYETSVDGPAFKLQAELQGVAGAIPKIRDSVADYLLSGRDALVQDLCKSKGLQFTDPEFPPTAASLLGKSSDKSAHAQVGLLSWARLSDVFGNPNMRIFEDISPTDILAGPLGVNYLLSAIGLLAERPALIRRLFNSDSLVPEAFQVVWLFINGQWREVIVDDYVPIFEEDDKTISLAFSRTFEDQAWLPLLEKAYAKVYGGYKSIEGGFFAESLRELTGAEVEVIEVNSSTEKEHLWNKLQQSLNTDCLVAGIVKEINTAGMLLVEEQPILDLACNIINAVEVEHPSDDSKHRIVQIRVISGQVNWTGLWSYQSRIWTAELRERYCKLGPEDGAYWMAYQDLLPYLQELTILYPTTDSLWNSIEVEGHNQEQNSLIAVSVETFKKGTYTISLDQTDARFINQDHTYSTIRMVLTRVFEDGKTVEHKACKFLGGKTVSMRTELSPGKYVLLAQVYWNQIYSRQLSINCQGPHMAGLTRVHLSSNEFKSLLYLSWRDYVVACPGFSIRKEITVTDDINAVKVKHEVLDKLKEYGVILNRWSLGKGAENIILNKSSVVSNLQGCEFISDHNDGDSHFMRISASKYALEIIVLNPAVPKSEISAEVRIRYLQIDDTGSKVEIDVLSLIHKIISLVPTTIQDRIPQKKGYIFCESKLISH